MNIKTEKLSIINSIIHLDNDMMLMTIKHLLELGNDTGMATTDFWDSLSPYQKNAVQQSLLEIERGEGIENEAVMSEMRQKLQR